MLPVLVVSVITVYSEYLTQKITNWIFIAVKTMSCSESMVFGKSVCSLSWIRLQNNTSTMLVLIGNLIAYIESITGKISVVLGLTFI